MLYWGIGTHLGEPWPQNKHGHVMGDVTDQGKGYGDPDVRGNEIGLVALDYHTDGSDLVGLMCLRAAQSGGLSCVANVVAIYNQLVRTRPDLVAALYEPLPYDYRGEQPPGGPPYYTFPVFSEHDGRIFVRFIPKYIYASQRHPEAPRLPALACEALDTVSAMANDPTFNVYMDLRPGEMQFINNYHVLHGRTAYVDDAASGHKRHLKRLWLATRSLPSRPSHFGKHNAHWSEKRSVSRIRPVEKKSFAGS
ncbi:MAG: TauD/TfdA family dioxygenase [Candidatus Eremiobacteraeota bacterium]|nr:TauD/TfdA family dioxygenase [Candidatus Eremiobacteraeota bacterium]